MTTTARILAETFVTMPADGGAVAAARLKWW